MKPAVSSSTLTLVGRCRAIGAGNNGGASLSTTIRRRITNTVLMVETPQKIQTLSDNNTTTRLALQGTTAAAAERNHQYHSKRCFVHLPAQSLPYDYSMKQQKEQEQQRSLSYDYGFNSLHNVHDNEDNNSILHDTDAATMNLPLFEATNMLEHDDVMDQEREYHERTMHVMSPTDTDISHNVGKESFFGYGEQAVNYDEDYDECNLHMTPASAQTSNHHEEFDGIEILQHEDVFDIRETRNHLWKEDRKVQEAKTIKSDEEKVFTKDFRNDLLEEEEVELETYCINDNTQVANDPDYEELLEGAWDATDPSGYNDPFDEVEAYECSNLEDDQVAVPKGNF